MQNFTDLARKRRSIRKFTPEKLSEDQVVELMKAALFAPSSKGLRAWEFVLVDNADLLHQLSECKPSGAAMVAEAPLAIVAVGHKGMERKPQNDEKLLWEKIHLNGYSPANDAQ